MAIVQFFFFSKQSSIGQEYDCDSTLLVLGMGMILFPKSAPKTAETANNFPPQSAHDDKNWALSRFPLDRLHVIITSANRKVLTTRGSV